MSASLEARAPFSPSRLCLEPILADGRELGLGSLEVVEAAGNRPFAATTVGAVWNKARTINGYDPDTWRYDTCGNPIKRSEYGNLNSEHDWEIDHMKPVAKGGSDDLSNLQPLQWDNNRQKSDAYPWSCAQRRAA